MTDDKNREPLDVPEADQEEQEPERPTPPDKAPELDDEAPVEPTPAPRP